MSLENEKNIQLTVVQPQNEEDEISIDFGFIWRGCKRFLALWLALALIVAALGVGIGLGTRSLVNRGNATALIEFTSSEADATTLQSPAVIEEAMNALGFSLDQLDDVRSNLSISGVLPDDTYDQKALYYNLITTNGGNVEAIRTLLNTSDATSRYVVSFNYHEAKMTQDEGILLLNQILASYRRYYNENNNSNTLLGSAAAVVDYKDYDYAEAVSIFTDLLDSTRTYLQSAINRLGTTFRSNETGYTLSDLLNREETLRTVEMPRMAAYINVNAVTSQDTNVVIAHYNYLIEELNRQKSVQESRLSSLKASVTGYERDPLLYTTDDSGQIIRSQTDDDAYDAMVQSMLTTQSEITDINTDIRYYQSVIDKMNRRTSVLESNAETADAYLAGFSQKLSQLIYDVNTTVSEYYEQAIQKNTLQVLVPAAVNAQSILKGAWVKYTVIAEVLLLLAYLGTAFLYGIIKGNPRKEPLPADL